MMKLKVKQLKEDKAAADDGTIPKCF